jgi:hypothetical protein
MDDDAGDQRTRRLHRVGVVARGDRLAEAAERGAVGGAQVGHQAHGGRLGSGSRLQQAVPLGLQRRQLPLKARAAQAIGDRVHQMRQLPLHALQLPPQPSVGHSCLGRQAVPFRRKLLGK